MIIIFSESICILFYGLREILFDKNSYNECLCAFYFYSTSTHRGAYEALDSSFDAEATDEEVVWTLLQELWSVTMWQLCTAGVLVVFTAGMLAVIIRLHSQTFLEEEGVSNHSGIREGYVKSVGYLQLSIH